MNKPKCEMFGHILSDIDRPNLIGTCKFCKKKIKLETNQFGDILILGVLDGQNQKHKKSKRRITNNS